MTEFQIKEQISLPATYSLTEGVEEQRNALALLADNIKAVATPADQVFAVATVRDIKARIAAVGEVRKKLTRPLDLAISRIIQLERDHNRPLAEQQDRLERLLTAFAATERDRVAAQDELRRNEIARKAAELDRKIEEARALEEAATNDKELDLALSAEIKAQEAKQNLYHSMAMAPATPAKVSGVFTNRVMEYEVTNVHVLYAARPDLCRLEPNASAIRAVCVPEMPVPGLKLWWVDKTTVMK